MSKMQLISYKELTWVKNTYLRLQLTSVAVDPRLALTTDTDERTKNWFRIQTHYQVTVSIMTGIITDCIGLVELDIHIYTLILL